MGKLISQIGENLSFVLECLGVFAALFVLALLFERFVMKNRKKLGSTHFLAYTAIFSAMAGVLMFIEIPLFFAPSFYEIDLSEIPIMICTFYLGPVSGVVAELLKIIVKLVFKGTTTAFVGDFANFVVGCSFVLPASCIYHMKKSKRGALIGMIAGTLVMTIFGSLFNAVYLLPTFAELFGMPLEAIIKMGNDINSAINSVSTLVLFCVVPFNLLKGIIVTVLTMLLYKRISPLLHKGDKSLPSARLRTDDLPQPQHAQGKIQAFVEINDTDIARQGIHRKHSPHEQYA